MIINVPDDLTELKERARRDNWHTYFDGSDIRSLLSEIESLRRELAHSKSLVKGYSDVARRG